MNLCQSNWEDPWRSGVFGELKCSGPLVHPAVAGQGPSSTLHSVGRWDWRAGGLLLHCACPLSELADLRPGQGCVTPTPVTTPSSSSPAPRSCRRGQLRSGSPSKWALNKSHTAGSPFKEPSRRDKTVETERVVQGALGLQACAAEGREGGKGTALVTPLQGHG